MAMSSNVSKTQICDITVIDHWQYVSSSQPQVQTGSVWFGNATALQRKHFHSTVNSALQSLAVISPSSLTSVCPAFSHKSEIPWGTEPAASCPFSKGKIQNKHMITGFLNCTCKTVQLMNSLSTGFIIISCHLRILIDSNHSPVLYFIFPLPWVDHLLDFWLVLYTLSVYSQIF